MGTCLWGTIPCLSLLPTPKVSKKCDSSIRRKKVLGKKQSTQYFALRLKYFEYFAIRTDQVSWNLEDLFLQRKKCTCFTE